ncbi:MAG: YbaB/EbfC family nucleoid-associated protein [Patescibacteria group bacterium]
MSILDKMKDMYEMRKQATQLQALLAKEKVTGASNNNSFKVTLDGNQNVLSVEIDQSIVGDKMQLEKSGREAFSKGLDALKKMMVSKFSSYLR